MYDIFAVSHSIIEDDFPEDILESHHNIKKRYATFADDTLYDYQQNNLLEPNKGYIKQSKEYFVKVLIVADNTMLDHHKTAAELTKYIMILMAYVSTYILDKTDIKRLECYRWRCCLRNHP